MDEHEHILDQVRAMPEGWVRTYGDITPGAPRLAGEGVPSTTAGRVRLRAARLPEPRG